MFIAVAVCVPVFFFVLACMFVCFVCSALVCLLLCWCCLCFVLLCMCTCVVCVLVPSFCFSRAVFACLS